MPEEALGIEAALERLDLDQRVRLLTGADFWSLYPEPAIGLRTIVVSDGPSGVRGATWDERSPSLNLPSATSLAAAWDPDLAYLYGSAMAEEAHRKGVDVVLGPTINLHRSPLGGRHFEAYSEDPLLTGTIAAAFVRGLQDNGVGACPKHYVANDFETERFTASVELSQRALHELYLAPFEQTVAAGTWTIMSAYNAVDGVTMSENDLLRAPLCDDWGFDGLVISDWTAVRSLAAARARQDLVMPGPRGAWGQALVDAVRDGSVPSEAVAEKVRRLLRLAVRVGAMKAGADHASAPLSPTPSTASDLDSEARGPATLAGGGLALALQAEARGIVLVANRGGLLPLGEVGTVAVIGEHAIRPRTQGGGSATVVPAETISPLDGLRAALPGAHITHHLGAVVNVGLRPLVLDTMTNPVAGGPGLQADLLAADGSVIVSEARRAATLMWLGSLPAGVARIEVTTAYRPAATGTIELGVSGAGHSRLSVDSTVLVDAAPHLESTDVAALVLDPPSLYGRLDVEAGVAYQLHLVYDLPTDGPLEGTCAMTLGWRAVIDSPDDLIVEAAAAAAAADIAVVVVGTTEKDESEGFDRTTLALPGRQDDLVAAVVAANPHTIVVVNAGSPVVMPWRHTAAAVLLTWFGGQEYGHALADVLTGAAEPGGRLPTTWPAAQADVPVIDVTPQHGVLRYDEGIHIGYRAWLKAAVAPAYPFGFGLGYTTWSYEGARVHRADDGSIEVDVTVRNDGRRAGREVVQVYLSRPDSAVDRPVRWLAGFAGARAEPGQAVDVTVTVARRAFEHWDEEAGGWRLEPGDFTVGVARHAAGVQIEVHFIQPT
jgi:beta-glucosidase